MSGVNQLTLIGNLVRDPELRYVTSGSPVCRMRLAVNSRYRTKDGKKGESVLFLDADAWGGLAEVCQAYLKKGRRVFLSGPLMYQEWKDKGGNRRNTYRMKVRQMQILDRPGEESADEEAANGGNGEAEADAEQEATPEEAKEAQEEETPF